MKKVAKVTLNNEWKAEGYKIDLGMNGYGIIKGGEIEYYNDKLYAILYLSEYSIDGWKFDNVKVVLNLSNGDIIIEPSDYTKVLEKGNPETIYFTNFHKFLIEGD